MTNLGVQLPIEGLLAATLTITAVAVGVIFATRQSYITSMRDHDMGVVTNLLLSQASSDAPKQFRVLACLHLLAAEDFGTLRFSGPAN